MNKRFIIGFLLFIFIFNYSNFSYEYHFSDLKKLSYNDSVLFRDWMHALSLSLFFPKLKNNNRWSKKNRDCASLIRYLVWEATSKHNGKWHLFFGNYLTRNLKDLSVKKPVSFYRNNKKVSYVSAKDLMKYNTDFITKDFRESNLHEADVLFFKTKQNSKIIYHSMLLIKNYQSGEWMVIYHTGDKKKGLRLVLLKDLFEHPQSKWHPSVQNPNFLGFFRLYFLD